MRLRLTRVVPSDFDAIIPLMFLSFSKVDLASVFFGRNSPASFAFSKRTLMNNFYNDSADVWLKVTDEDEEVDVDVLHDETGQPTGRKIRMKRIIAASNWKVFPTFNADEHDRRNGGAEAAEKTMQMEQAGGVLDADSHHKATAVATVKHADGEITKDPMEPVGPHAHITWHNTPEEKRDAAMILADFMARRLNACREAHILCFLMFVDPAYQRKGAGSMVMQWGAELADTLMLPSWIEASTEGEHLYRHFGFLDVERVKMDTESFLSEYLHMRRPVSVGAMERGKEKTAALQRLPVHQQ